MSEKLNTVEDFDVEKVLDEQISPLMKQVLEICKEHKIPMVSSFCYRSNGDGLDFSTSLIIPKTRYVKELVSAGKLIKEGFLAFEVTRSDR